MKSSETRITALLVLAISSVVAATYWLTLNPRATVTPWDWARGGAIVAGTAVCLSIGVGAILRDIRTQRQRVLDHAKQWVLSASSAALPAPRDADIQPFINPLREKLDELRSRADSLAIQKKNLEIQLRLADAQRRQAETMIHGISDAVIVTDQQGRLTMMNPVAEALTGYTTGEAKGLPLPEVFRISDEVSQKPSPDIAATVLRGL